MVLMKTMRPKFVLFDANIIIEAYELGIWENLVESVEVYVPSIVAHDEVRFVKKEIGRIPEEINLPELISHKRIFEISAEIEEMAQLDKIFDGLFLQRIHAGEREALAILYLNKKDDLLFCTADAMPIKGIAMLQLSERGLSFERLLKTIGIQKRLKRYFTKKWFKDKLDEGKQNLITGSGLKEEYRNRILKVKGFNNGNK